MPLQVADVMAKAIHANAQTTIILVMVAEVYAVGIHTC